MTDVIFAYGTLRDKSIIKEVLGRIPKTFPARLNGFRLETVNLEGINYPILIEDQTSIILIEGEYFMVDATDIKKLDLYETSAYRRIKVNLENGLGAWIYCL